MKPLPKYAPLLTPRPGDALTCQEVQHIRRTLDPRRVSAQTRRIVLAHVLGCERCGAAAALQRAIGPESAVTPEEARGLLEGDLEGMEDCGT